MVIAVLADEVLKKEFLSKPVTPDTEIIWADSIRSLCIIEADLYFDLLFDLDPERIAALKRLLPAPVVVNSVIATIKEIGQPFIRINAWPTMLKRSLVEIAAGDASQEARAKELFEQLGWPIEPVADTTGMVTPRILSMIINEASFTQEEGISTAPEIDTAMRLGTNYPSGPFEWVEKIGIEKIVALLSALGKTAPRYTMASSLHNKSSS